MKKSFVIVVCVTVFAFIGLSATMAQSEATIRAAYAAEIEELKAAHAAETNKLNTEIIAFKVMIQKLMSYTFGIATKADVEMVNGNSELVGKVAFSLSKTIWVLSTDRADSTVQEDMGLLIEKFEQEQVYSLGTDFYGGRLVEYKKSLDKKKGSTVTVEFKMEGFTLSILFTEKLGKDFFALTSVTVEGGTLAHTAHWQGGDKEPPVLFVSKGQVVEPATFVE